MPPGGWHPSAYQITESEKIPWNVIVAIGTAEEVRFRMAASNIALFQRAYRAFVERRDLNTFYEMLAPDVEWRAWNDEGNCHNRDEVMEVISSALERGVPPELPEFIDGGDRVVLITSAVPPFFPADAEGLFQVVEIRDGKIVALRDFIRRNDALAAAGLSAP
jgi:ketosteroid isomerase-like protein